MNEPLRGIPAPAPPVMVNIERLVLDGMGYTAAQGALVQRALELELARLIAQPASDSHWHGSAVPSLSATSVRVGAAPHPAQLGRDVAQSIFATLRASP